MTDMLEGVVKEGTGRKARVLRHPAAGKTGTTDAYIDALFIGFTPSLVTGVWVGRDMQKTLGNLETGARAALPIWIEFMRAALAQRPYQYFDIPDDVVKVWMAAEHRPQNRCQCTRGSGSAVYQGNRTKVNRHPLCGWLFTLIQIERFSSLP